jgi:hypothetical protein
MNAHGAIAGRVVDATGAPVVGASVAIADGSQPYPEIGAVTDASGRFRLGRLQPGSYRVAAHLHGRNGSSPAVIGDGQNTPVEIVLP